MRFLQQFRKRAVRRAAGILTACCVTVSTLTAVSVPVSAANSGSCGPNAKCSLSGTTLTISGSGAADNIYAYNNLASAVTDIVVSDGITSLPKDAFSNFSKVTSLQMADSVTSLGNYCCSGCASLKNLKLSDNLTEIPLNAFYSCPRVSELKLPSKLKTIGDYAFYCMIDLKALTLPDTVTSVGKFAFYGNNIKTLSLGKSLQTIGDKAFDYSCFQSVTIPSTIQSIGKNAISPYWDVVEFNHSRVEGKCYNAPGKTLIKGTPGTAAETYAKDNNLPFEAYGSAHTHVWSDWKVQTAAGCETDGVQTRTCSGCGMTEEQVIPAAGHKMGDWKNVVPQTCTEDGRNERVCAVCGKTESQFLPATGHDYSDWVVEKPATVSADGLRVRTCRNCGDRIEETLPKLLSYPIIASAGTGGSISPSGTITAEAGSNQTFTIKPNDGYRIKSILVDSMEQAITETYTFTTVTASHTIEAIFEQIPVVPQRQCIQIKVTPQQAAWCSDETSFSMNDFKVTAYISDNGTVVEQDITAQCSTDSSPKQLTADGSYGFKTVPFHYNGSDNVIRNYQNGNSISASVPVYLRGDFNTDGRIQAIDANQTLIVYLDQILENYETPVSDIQAHLIDVDSDGQITARDAMFILTYFIESDLFGNAPTWQEIIPQ